MLLTSGRGSTLANIADRVIYYEKIETMQLMKTVYEQFSYLLFDSCSSLLAEIGTLSVSEIETNHSVLE